MTSFLPIIPSVSEFPLSQWVSGQWITSQYVTLAKWSFIHLLTNNSIFMKTLNCQLLWETCLALPAWTFVAQSTSFSLMTVTLLWALSVCLLYHRQAFLILVCSTLQGSLHDKCLNNNYWMNESVSSLQCVSRKGTLFLKVRINSREAITLWRC